MDLFLSGGDYCPQWGVVLEPYHLQAHIIIAQYHFPVLKKMNKMAPSFFFSIPFWKSRLLRGNTHNSELDNVIIQSFSHREREKRNYRTFRTPNFQHSHDKVEKRKFIYVTILALVESCVPHLTTLPRDTHPIIAKIKN